MKFLDVLTLIFITLKLTGVINWSWWLVLLPLYFPLIIILVVAVLVTICVIFDEE